MPAGYSAPDGRKGVSTSWNPVELVRSPNWLTLAALAVLLVLAAGIVLGVRAVICGRRRRRYEGHRRFPFGK